MMQLDTRLPLATQQGPSFNEDMGGAMTLSNMARKRNAEDMAMLQQQQAQQAAMAKQNAINQVFKSSLDESGNLDQKRAIAGLYSVDPAMAKDYESKWVADTEKKSAAMKAQSEAMDFQGKLADRIHDYNKQRLDTTSAVLGAVTDAATYQHALPIIRSLGITPEMLPDNYLPEAVNVFKAQAITAKDQIENAYKNRQQTEVERANKDESSRGWYNAKTNRINAEKAGSGTADQKFALKSSEFGEKEKDIISSVEEGKTLMSNLVDTYKRFGFGGAKSAPGEIAAKTPLVGKFIAGKSKEFQNQKRLAAETWLRAATGAAAPDSEVKTYTNFLPNESDPPEQAQKKMLGFFDKISAKATGRAKAIELEGKGLEQRGLTDLANVKYQQVSLIKGLIDEARSSIPSITGATENKKATISDDDALNSLFPAKK
jgi:hypothetical protein